MTKPDQPAAEALQRRLAADARREAILVAAMRAFATAPYAAVSVRAIGRAAGVSEALVHKYFEGKPGLYTEVVARAVDDLRARQRAADAALPAGTSVRDRVRVSLEAYLDHIAEGTTGWAAPFLVAGNDPQPAHELRRRVRREYVDLLGGLLGIDPASGDVRRRYALHGYFGHLDAACLAWVEQGCPADHRAALVDGALGALEGALGDWG